MGQIELYQANLSTTEVIMELLLNQWSGTKNKCIFNTKIEYPQLCKPHFQIIFLCESFCILTWISLEFVANSPVNMN